MADAAMPVNNAITAAFAKYSRIPEYDQYIPVSRRTNRLGISSAIKEHIPTARTITQPDIQKTFFLAGNLICMPQWMETRIIPLPPPPHATVGSDMPPSFPTGKKRDHEINRYLSPLLSAY